MIPYLGVPKARPRVTKNGTFMPKGYVEWKENVAEIMALTMHPISGRCRLEVCFEKKQFTVKLIRTDEERFGQADVDNLAGAVMDALQESGVIDNDRDVVDLHVWFRKENG